MANGDVFTILHLACSRRTPRRSMEAKRSLLSGHADTFRRALEQNSASGEGGAVTIRSEIFSSCFFAGNAAVERGGLCTLERG